MELKHFFLTIILAIAIYSILTMPHLLLLVCTFGIKYPMWLMLSCGVISSILSPILAKSKLFN